MSRRWMSPALIGAVLLLLCSANTWAAGADRPGRVVVLWLGTPWIPGASSVEVLVPLSGLDAPVLRDLTVRTWYLAQGPFFLPDRFVELGAVLVYGFTSSPRPVFELGLGTAVSHGVVGFSVPAIATLQWNVWLGTVADVIPRFEAFVYSHGLILDTSLGLELHLAPDWPLVQVSAYAEAAGQLTPILFSGTTGLRVGLGWEF